MAKSLQMNYPNPSSSFHLYTCLPFIELAHETSIQMGPAIFWPASKFQYYVSPSLQPVFHSYLQSIIQIKAKAQMQLINTVQLSPESTTCISIHDDVLPEQKEFLLIDSLYLLYFVCTFRNLYYSQEIPSFNAFTKVIPTYKEFINNKSNWEDLHIEETDREETVCIHLFDQEIPEGLGKVLTAIYVMPSSVPKDVLNNYKRLIRSIRYLVDRFFQRFVNLFEHDPLFSQELFAPQDVLSLALSFETLFDISDRYPTSDFKHKLRPLLQIKYSRPLELFWKWVDEFYELKKKLIQGAGDPDSTFRLNPNFEISHILIGIKLFIYSIYHTFFQYQLLSSKTSTLRVLPEEVLVFFWTEASLLHKLSDFFAQLAENQQQEELYEDIALLASLYIAMQAYRDQKFNVTHVKFIPTPIGEIKEDIEKILGALQKLESRAEIMARLNAILPKNFGQTLESLVNPL